MMQDVTVEQQQTVIEIEAETTLVYIEETGVEIISVGEQGPPGPAGTSPGAPRIEELIVSGSVPTQYVLTDSPQPATLALWINGIRQATNAFSALGPTVTLPSTLEIQIDDLLTFTYMMN